MRGLIVLFLVAAPAGAKPPDGDPDLVLFFTEPPRYKRSQWLEALREHSGVAADDKKKIRELSRQPFGPRLGTTGGPVRKFVFERVRYHGFQVAVPKKGGKPGELTWLKPVACGDSGFRADGKEYEFDGIADWRYFDSLLKETHGDFVMDAMRDLSQRSLTERD